MWLSGSLRGRKDWRTDKQLADAPLDCRVKLPLWSPPSDGRKKAHMRLKAVTWNNLGEEAVYPGAAVDRIHRTGYVLGKKKGLWWEVPNTQINYTAHINSLGNCFCFQTWHVALYDFMTQSPRGCHTFWELCFCKEAAGWATVTLVDRPPISWDLLSAHLWATCVSCALLPTLPLPPPPPLHFLKQCRFPCVSKQCITRCESRAEWERECRRGSQVHKTGNGLPSVIMYL